MVNSTWSGFFDSTRTIRQSDGENIVLWDTPLDTEHPGR
jgi:hypothetical protein